jgi:pyruvate-formate lyase-activating enzyme
MKIAVSLLILLIPTFTKAQNHVEEIKKVFESYRLLVEQKEYDRAFDYYREDFLKYLPKEDLKKQFSSFNNSEKLEYSVSNSRLVFVSEILAEASKKYSFLRYSSLYHFQFHATVEQEEIERIKNIFKRDNGDRYSYDEQNKTITIYKEQELIAVKEADWRFLLYKEKLNPYMNIWIPDNVFKALLEKRQGKNFIK